MYNKFLNRQTATAALFTLLAFTGTVHASDSTTPDVDVASPAGVDTQVVTDGAVCNVEINPTESSHIRVTGDATLNEAYTINCLVPISYGLDL